MSTPPPPREQDALEAALIKDLCRVFQVQMRAAREAHYKVPVDVARRKSFDPSPNGFRRARVSRMNRTLKFSTGGLGGV